MRRTLFDDVHEDFRASFRTFLQREVVGEEGRFGEWERAGIVPREVFALAGRGGFLGMAEKYHPLPWAALDYDENQNSYVVNYTKEQLQAAPAGSVEELTQNDGLTYRDRTYKYYKVDRYWEDEEE